MFQCETELSGVRAPIRKAASSGFTLIEVLVTVVVLSTGLIVVLQAMNASIKGMRDARDALLADAFSRAKLSEMDHEASTLGAGALAAHQGEFPTGDGLVASVIVEPAMATEDRESSTDADDGLYRVAVTVWRPPDGNRYTSATLFHIAEESR